MSSMRHPDNIRPPSSLSESWASLSVSDEHSEDGTRSELTDIGSLIDQSGPDDVASLDGRYSSSEMGGNDDDQDDTVANDVDDPNEAAVPQGLPALFPQADSDINDGSLSTETAFLLSVQSTDSIEFVEPDDWNEGQVELKHTIRILGEAEASEIRERHLCDVDLHDCILSTVIQQTMAKQGLDLDKPFRVLYVGSPEFRNIILDKIGDVLVSNSCNTYDCSSTESSRYHVVPTSFGVDAVPNFAELLPIHVQLVVDECLRATALNPEDHRRRTITLRLKNRPPCTSALTNSTHCITSASDWTLPDVAIFFVSRIDDEETIRTRYLTHLFMEDHGVPTMTISEEPLWKVNSNLIPVNTHALHMCLESRNTVTGESAVFERYPIDLKTFESICPGQLNRNLASLVSLYPKRTYKVTADTRISLKANTPVSAAPALKPSLPMLANCIQTGILITVLLGLLGLSIITVIAPAMVLIAPRALRIGNVLGPSKLSTQSAMPDYVSPTWCDKSLSTICSVSGGSSPASNSVKRTLANNFNHGPKDQLLDGSGFEAFTTTRTGPQFLPTQNESFQIHVVGDCHVVIKSPRLFMAPQKRRGFNVSVHRNDQALVFEQSKLFDGVYSLKLNREDAYGLVNVTITLDSKPPLTQSVQVDFATPWLKISNWKQAVQDMSSHLVKDLITVHMGVSEICDRFCTDLQVLVGDVVKKSHYLRHDAELLSRDSMQRTLQTRDVVLSKSKQISCAVKLGALQRYRTALSALKRRSKQVDDEATQLMRGMWNRLRSQVSIKKVDIQPLKSQIEIFNPSQALRKAQMQARSLVQWRYNEASEHPQDRKRPNKNQMERRR